MRTWEQINAAMQEIKDAQKAQAAKVKKRGRPRKSLTKSERAYELQRKRQRRYLAKLAKLETSHPLRFIEKRWSTIAADKRRRGHEFTIAWADLEWPTRCPVFNLPLDYTGKDPNMGWSLDRLDSSKGYIEGNVRVISQKANRMKSNGTLKDIQNLAQWASTVLSI